MPLYAEEMHSNMHCNLIHQDEMIDELNVDLGIIMIKIW